MADMIAIAALNKIKTMSNVKKIGEWTKIQKPSGFLWDAPINVYRNANGEIGTDFDVADYEYVGAGKIYYIDIANGSDSNDGLTIRTAFKTVQKALMLLDYDIIYIANGNYNIANGFNNININRSLSIKALPGATATIGAYDTPTWALSSGKTYTYEATISDAYAAYDAKYLSVYGDYTKLTLQTSIENVEANAGSYYINGTTVYVRTNDSRAPDADIRVYKNVSNLKANGNLTVYLEGINLEGGDYPLYVYNTASGQTPRFYAKNCTFKYSNNDGCVNVSGYEYAFLQNCVAALSSGDGFGYHSTNSVSPKIIEVNCVGRDNGSSGATINNGSTIHGGESIVRVNGKYYRNVGPNVADVQQSQTWCLGCEAYASLTTNTNANIDFEISDVTGGSSEGWLDTCKGFGSKWGVNARHAAGVIHLHNCDFNTQSATGTIDNY